jgi:catechol 2,3-dioxygenase
MSELPFAATTPVSVSRVGLKARDAVALAEYYGAVVGLRELSRDSATITLGTGDRALLEIESDPAVRPDDPRQAGLFHTAFLLPSRCDLARWIRHAAEKSIRIDGASDHLVSEAIYLTDPEGNGIEIYADRPRDEWPWKGSAIAMATLKLDFPDLMTLLSENDPGWQGAPDGSVIGHVHLRVGDPRAAEEWWNSEMGFDTMAKYGADAVFLSSGGYHHHIGANSWHSRGAGPRDTGRAGLSWVELKSDRAETTSEKRDPWGTVVRTVPVDR